ncbi:MAG: replication-relaxation family protein [Solirubrobacteraceae bacterium]
MTGRYLTAAMLRNIEARCTAQDWAVIQQVSNLRFVNGSQLTRLCFMDSNNLAANGRSARRALLRLVRLEVLARLPRPVGGVRSGSAGFVYYLGVAGQRLATARGWQPERRRRRSQSPGSLFLGHTLQVAELHTLLIEADRSRRFELLELAGEPACWRSYKAANGQRCTLKPDSYARLGIGAWEHSLWFEVDRGTEGSRALDSQLRRYVAYHASGSEQTERGVFPKTLWLTNTPERVGVIEGCVNRLPMQAQELFQVASFDDALNLITATEPTGQH